MKSIGHLRERSLLGLWGCRLLLVVSLLVGRGFGVRIMRDEEPFELEYFLESCYLRGELGSSQKSASPIFSQRYHMAVGPPRIKSVVTGPSPLSSKRVVQTPMILFNSLHPPVSPHLSTPTIAIALHEKAGSDAHNLDPMRSYRQRQDAAETKLYQFTTTEKNSLHFGEGK